MLRNPKREWNWREKKFRPIELRIASKQLETNVSLEVKIYLHLQTLMCYKESWYLLYNVYWIIIAWTLKGELIATENFSWPVEIVSVMVLILGFSSSLSPLLRFLARCRTNLGHCVTLGARLVSSFSDPWYQTLKCAIVWFLFVALSRSVFAWSVPCP